MEGIEQILRPKYLYIDKVGVELEGGWNLNRGDIGHDGSVEVQAPYKGEIIPPEPKTPKGILNWVYDNYPDVVNSTCGMHIHVSFKKMQYYAHLMDEEFHQYALTYLNSWGNQLSFLKDGKLNTKYKLIAKHPFWERLRGGNGFCMDKFMPEKQVHQRGHHQDRYTQFNFTWARFKTIECRLMPMFAQKEIAVSAVAAFLDCCEGFLANHRKRRDAKVAGVIESEDELAPFEEAPIEDFLKLEGVNPDPERVSFNTESPLLELMGDIVTAAINPVAVNDVYHETFAAITQMLPYTKSKLVSQMKTILGRYGGGYPDDEFSTSSW